MASGNLELTEAYLNRKTLIMGDVNSGKTRRTLAIVDDWCRSGHGRRMVLLDLAPETTSGIGGKMRPSDPQILVLSDKIQAPRLTGKDAPHIQALAQCNAHLIEPLLDQALTCQRAILVVNDASLYLQAGSHQRFLAVVETFGTVLLNAYYGHSFVPAPFTEIEHAGVMALAKICDTVIPL